MSLVVEAVGKVLSHVCLYRNGAADALILQELAVFRIEILAGDFFYRLVGSLAVASEVRKAKGCVVGRNVAKAACLRERTKLYS